MRFLLTSTVTTLIGLFLAVPAANAQSGVEGSPPRLSGTVFAGIATLPDFEGSSRQKTIPVGGGEVRWDKRYFAVDGVAARLNLLNSDTFEFGPVADLTFGRDNDVKSPTVRALGRIDDAYQLGAFAAVKTGSGLIDGDELRVSVQAVQDVSDVHDGWLGETSASYRVPLGTKLAVSTTASLRVADDKFAATYFSVSPSMATISRLAAYTAKGGVRDAGVSLAATYSISDRWSLVGFVGYRRLVGSLAKSPIVRNEGSRDQVTSGLGVGVNF